MCKVVKWKYILCHIIYELCFQCFSHFVWFVFFSSLWAMFGMTECPKGIKALHHWAYALQKKNIFAVTLNIIFFFHCHWTKRCMLYSMILCWRQNRKNDFQQNIMNKCVLWEQPWSGSLFVLLLHLNFVMIFFVAANSVFANTDGIIFFLVVVLCHLDIIWLVKCNSSAWQIQTFHIK